MSDLPPTPDTLYTDDGTPRWGTYRGSCRSTDLSRSSAAQSSNAGGRFFREKRWQWFGAGNDRVACGGTLFDAGYATTLFFWIFDRSSRRMVVDEMELLPPFAVEVRDEPVEGGGAHLRGLSRTFAFERGRESATLEVNTGGIDVELEFHTDLRDPVTAICPVGDDRGSGIDVTQKENCLPVRGRMAAEGRVFELGDDTYGMLDYTHGLFPRETSWEWTMACGVLEEGVPIGVNFSQNFTGGYENVVWLGDEIRHVGDVDIEFDAGRPSEPWTVRSKDGTIDLSMVVEGVREHETNFQLVSSSYIQPIGCLHGRIVDREVHDLYGVAESHHARW